MSNMSQEEREAEEMEKLYILMGESPLQRISRETRNKKGALYTDAPEVIPDEDVESIVGQNIPEPVWSRLFPFQGMVFALE